jgi:hypothetical protein
MREHFLCEEAVAFNRLDFHSGRPVLLGGLSHTHCLIRAGFAYLDYCHHEWSLECIEKEGHVIVLEGRIFRPDVMAVI